MPRSSAKFVQTSIGMGSGGSKTLAPEGVKIKKFVAAHPDVLKATEGVGVAGLVAVQLVPGADVAVDASLAGAAAAEAAAGTAVAADRAVAADTAVAASEELSSSDKVLKGLESVEKTTANAAIIAGTVAIVAAPAAAAPAAAAPAAVIGSWEMPARSIIRCMVIVALIVALLALLYYISLHPITAHRDGQGLRRSNAVGCRACC